MGSLWNYIVRFCKTALEPDVVLSSLKVALVVGVILNLINQWQAVTALDWQAISWSKLLLTFCVPYLVSTYASVMTELRKRG